MCRIRLKEGNHQELAEGPALTFLIGRGIPSLSLRSRLNQLTSKLLLLVEKMKGLCYSEVNNI